MIVKKIPARTAININRLETYLRDGDNAVPGEPFGPKVDPDYALGLGFVSDDWHEQVAEFKELSQSYVGESDPVQHWVISWAPGEHPTPAQFRETWTQFAADQGMTGHQLLITAHTDHDGVFHGHAALNRIRPEPDDNGRYLLEWSNGRVASIQKKSGERHTNQALCAQATAVEMSVRQNWRLLDERRFDWTPETGLVKRHNGNPEKIALGSRVETWEALNNAPHAKRLLAERTIEILREAHGDKAAAVASLARQGIIYKDEDYLDNKGRRHVGGVVSIGKEKVKISALPSGDRWIAKAPAVAAVPVDKAAGEALLLSHDKIKDENPTHVVLHDDLSIVNEKSIESALPKKSAIGGRPAQDDILVVAAAAFAGKKPSKFTLARENLVADALPIFNEYAAQGRSAVETVLAGEGIALIEATASIKQQDGTEKEIRYGQLKKGEITVPLSALGRDESGKAIHSLGSLNRAERVTLREALVTDAAPYIVDNAHEGRGAVQTALAIAGIRLTEATTIITDKASGEEKQVVYGQLERDGVTVPLSAFGKIDGKSEFGLGALGKNERDREREALVAEALPVVQHAAFYGREAVEKALEKRGIALVETTTTISDENGGEKEIRFGKIEKDGVSVSLAALGKHDGKTIYSLGYLNKNTRLRAQEKLIADALPIVRAGADQGRSGVVGALAASGIALVETTSTIKDETTGEEKSIRYGRIERDGISISLSALGKKEGRALYSLGGFEYTERQIHQDNLRAEALPIVESHAAQGWRAVSDALAAQGIAFGETVAVIKDKSTGKEKELTYAQISRGDISVSLKSLGQNDSGLALFQTRELQRVQLARDFATITDHCQSWREAEAKAASAGITYSRVRVTTDDDQVFTVARLERDGITTTTSLAGDDYKLSALDNKFMPFDRARDWFDKARLEPKPVEYLVSQGLTSSDIDRISRIGEYAEAHRPEVRERDVPVQTAQPNKKQKTPSIASLLAATVEDVETIALVAQEKLRVIKAKSEAETARTAVRDMKAAIQTEIKPQAKPQEMPMANDQKPTTPKTVSTEKPLQDKALDDKAARERERDLEKMREREKDLERQREREKEREKERQRERDRQRQ